MGCFLEIGAEVNALINTLNKCPSPFEIPYPCLYNPVLKHSLELTFLNYLNKSINPSTLTSPGQFFEIVKNYACPISTAHHSITILENRGEYQSGVSE